MDPKSFLNKTNLVYFPRVNNANGQVLSQISASSDEPNRAYAL